MKLLLLTWFDPNGVLTVREHIENIRKHSRHTIDVFNTFAVAGRASLAKRLQLKGMKYMPKNISSYDGIILHNTVTYNVDFVRSLNERFSPALADFPGLKIMMKQDEMRRVNACRELMRAWKIDLLLTCVPPAEVEKVYPSTFLPELKLLHTFTGYVTPQMREFRARSYEERAIDVCYRGMEPPFEWGILGQEKFRIGEDFKRAAMSSGRLRLNISSKTADRLDGMQWIDLLNSSRAALAVESGASIFDWTGEIEQTVHKIRSENPEISFDEIWSSYLKAFEGNVAYGQISPRHIEAAYTRTLQVLFEGEYSGLLKPWIHYVPLKKDLSNFSEVELAIQDRESYIRMTQNAFESLILNPDLSYQTFVRRFDLAIDELT